MASYPVVFDIKQQETYNRVHIAIRLLIIVILAILAGALGWTYGLLFLAVPVLAAILIAQRGANQYFAEAETNMVLWLRWVTALYCYLFLLTDSERRAERDAAVRGHTSRRTDGGGACSFGSSW